MHAVHYEIGLPADYDMEIVRERVRTRGAATDAWPDLAYKAYLVRETGVEGSLVNAYAPFSVWNDTPGLNAFMWGGGFGAVIRDFGRPAAQHWIGLAFEPGPAVGQPPRSATRDTWPIPPDSDPATAIAKGIAELEAIAVAPAAHSAALAIDTRSWELVRFTLWFDAAPADAPGAHFQVLHLSAPGIEAIRPGRHW